MPTLVSSPYLAFFFDDRGVLPSFHAPYLAFLLSPNFSFCLLKENERYSLSKERVCYSDSGGW